MAEPVLRDDIKTRRGGFPPEYDLLLPPHSSLQVLLVIKPTRPEKVTGIIVYNPVMNGGGYIGDGLAKAKQACIFSNDFACEVVAAEQK